MSKETETIKALLNEYAQSINTRQLEQTASFYATDGLFLPESMPTLAKPDIAGKTTGRFLTESGFKISYKVEDITQYGDFSFVMAEAFTSTKDAITEERTEKRSRDLFILRKETGEWKIFRYMFNNVVLHSS